jgi:hypothetical protein
MVSLGWGFRFVQIAVMDVPRVLMLWIEDF